MVDLTNGAEKSLQMPSGELKAFFDEKVLAYNQPGFIPSDPISIPHRFSRIQDIEISGFIAATLAWGQRVTIINKCNELLERMDRAPYDFVLNHTEADLKRLVDFKHRTFNTTDTLYFMEFFRWFYQQYDSLEDGFLVGTSREAPEMEKGIAGFNRMFFSLPEAPDRTKKHVATPERKSACKRINMFLRWMVRQDTTGVDFGLWKVIQPRHLVCPCDIHVGRVARRFGLITRQQNDWRTAMELTENLRLLDSDDPVKYDFALFGLGVFEKLQ